MKISSCLRNIILHATTRIYVTVALQKTNLCGLSGNLNSNESVELLCSQSNFGVIYGCNSVQFESN